MSSSLAVTVATVGAGATTQAALKPSNATAPPPPNPLLPLTTPRKNQNRRLISSLRSILSQSRDHLPSGDPVGSSYEDTENALFDQQPPSSCSNNHHYNAAATIADHHEPCHDDDDDDDDADAAFLLSPLPASVPRLFDPSPSPRHQRSSALGAVTFQLPATATSMIPMSPCTTSNSNSDSLEQPPVLVNQRTPSRAASARKRQVSRQDYLDHHSATPHATNAPNISATSCKLTSSLRRMHQCSPSTAVRDRQRDRCSLSPVSTACFPHSPCINAADDDHEVVPSANVALAADHASEATDEIYSRSSPLFQQLQQQHQQESRSSHSINADVPIVLSPSAASISPATSPLRPRVLFSSATSITTASGGTLTETDEFGYALEYADGGSYNPFVTCSLHQAVPLMSSHASGRDPFAPTPAHTPASLTGSSVLSIAQHFANSEAHFGGATTADALYSKNLLVTFSDSDDEEDEDSFLLNSSASSASVRSRSLQSNDDDTAENSSILRQAEQQHHHNQQQQQQQQQQHQQQQQQQHQQPQQPQQPLPLGGFSEDDALYPAWVRKVLKYDNWIMPLEPRSLNKNDFKYKSDLATYQHHFKYAIQAGFVLQIWKTRPADQTYPTTLIDDFEIGRPLGSGTTGTIYLARARASRFLMVAIKVIHKVSLEARGVRQVEREVANLLAVRGHPNIISLFDCFQDENRIYLVTEYAPHGDLYKMLQAEGLTEATSAKIFQQAAMGIQHCHQKGLLHRDIKPENFVWGCDGKLKLIDFGWSAPFGGGHRRQTLCGTLDYLAPELVNGSFYHDAVDRWCLGVLLYELLVGCPPFEDENVKVTKLNIRDVMYDMPSFLSAGAQNLIDGLLQQQPRLRLGLDEVLEHPWLVIHARS